MPILLNWIWQGSALTLVVALVVCRLRGVNAATRERIWWATLAAVCLMPLIPLLGFAPAAGLEKRLVKPMGRAGIEPATLGSKAPGIRFGVARGVSTKATLEPDLAGRTGAGSRPVSAGLVVTLLAPGAESRSAGTRAETCTRGAQRGSGDSVPTWHHSTSA